MAGGRTSATKITLAERRHKAVQMRKAGASYPAIAAKLAQEYSSKYNHTAAYKDVDAVLRECAEQTAHDAEELRTLELERYDSYLLALAAKIQQGDAKAIATAIQISDRRCKLLGLDAPIQVKIQEGIESGLELELSQFLDSLALVLDNATLVKVLEAVNSLQTRSGTSEAN